MASVQDRLDAAMDRAEAQGEFRRQREVELKALLTQYASNECADDDGVASVDVSDGAGSLQKQAQQLKTAIASGPQMYSSNYADEAPRPARSTAVARAGCKARVRAAAQSPERRARPRVTLLCGGFGKGTVNGN